MRTTRTRIGGDLEQLKQHNQRIAWLESVKKRVAGTNGRTRNEFPATWDVHFYLRRAYHFLYEYYGRVEAGTASPEMTTAMRIVGRIIKALKMVRDYVPAVFFGAALLASFFLRSMSRHRVRPCFDIRESKLARAEHREPAGAGAALPAPAPQSISRA